MNADLRIGSLNLRAYPNPRRNQVQGLTKVIAKQNCDVLLLQECLKPWLEEVCKAVGMTGVHSHDLPPDASAKEFSPDGCAIAFRKRLETGEHWRLPPESFMPGALQKTLFEELPPKFRPMPPRLAYRYSGRSILAKLALGGERVVVGSFHATPGTGKVGGKKVREWKPFFHGAVAVELARIRSPFVFAIDANEPVTETVDSIGFHPRYASSGVRKMQALLGLDPEHRGRDLFREWLKRTGDEPASANVLLATYAPKETMQRRFDSMWASPEFELGTFTTLLPEVVKVGGDHAMLVAELSLKRSNS